MAKLFEKILTDAAAGLYEESWQISSDSVPDYSGPPWFITKFTLKGGKQHGVDVIELDNGEMAITIVPTRGMNIYETSTSNVTMGWNSPVRELVHPAYIQEAIRGGLGWLEGFNELVCRCGLESTGAPGPDEIRDNQGNKKVVVLPLHGRISNTPASKVWVAVELEKPYRLTVAGEVYDTRMFGPSYLLRAAVTTHPGQTSFTIQDEIVNLCAVPVEMELLYHCNYGPPILSDGARLVAPVKKVSARDAVALEGMKTWDRYGPPQAGFVEQCYFLELHAGRSGETAVALVSGDGELAATLRFPLKQLPAFTLWKNTAALADGYVTWLEPGTDYPNARQFERERGRVAKIPAGRTVRATLTLGLARGKREVRHVCAEIARIGKGKPREICRKVDADLSPAG
jgi:hypothetical protein